MTTTNKKIWKSGILIVLIALTIITCGCYTKMTKVEEIPPEPASPQPVGITDQFSKYEETSRSEIYEGWQDSQNNMTRDVEAVDDLMNITPYLKKEEKEPVTIKNKIWCNGIQIGFEETASLQVGFINEKIQFNFKVGKFRDFISYCPWCYDNVKNYDEEGVDCGPSCESCNRVEEPIKITDYKCGDKQCQEGNEYLCPEDCRNFKLTAPLITLLIISLIVNTNFWGYYKRKGRLDPGTSIMFGVNTAATAGALIYVVIQYLCVSPMECEYLTSLLALLTAIITLSIIIFKVPYFISSLAGRVQARREYSQVPEKRQTLIEIDSLIRKTQKCIERGYVGAAESLYKSIDPLYGTLSDRQKRKVIEKIRKLHTKIEMMKRDKTNP